MIIENIILMNNKINDNKVEQRIRDNNMINKL
jgi:hypothetical protein